LKEKEKKIETADRRPVYFAEYENMKVNVLFVLNLRVVEIGENEAIAFMAVL
jgi:hypothetical protein